MENIFTYNINTIHSPSVLMQALTFVGVDDAVITVNGNVKIETNYAADLCDTAISLSAPGALLGAKADKIKAVEDKTFSLTTSGAVFTKVSNGKVSGPIEISYNNRGQLRDLKGDVADGFVTLPQMIPDTNGRGVQLDTSGDVDAAYLAVLNRGVYLLNDGVNGDGSSGEAKLIIDILAAADQAELDLIIDTRE